MLLDFADAGDHRVVAAARARARLFEPLRIGLGVDELQRVADREVRETFRARFRGRR